MLLCWKLRQLVLLKLKACAQYNMKSTWLLHGSHAGHMIASWEGRWGPWHWSSELPAPPTPAPGVSVKSQSIKSNAFIHVSCTAGWSFTIWASREDPSKHRTQKHIRSTTFKVLILEFGKMPLSKQERIPFQGQHDGMWIVLTCRWPRKHSTLIKKKKFTCVCCRLLLQLSRFSRVRLCATPYTAARQATPSLGFSRQEHWSGVLQITRVQNPLGAHCRHWSGRAQRGSPCGLVCFVPLRPCPISYYHKACITLFGDLNNRKSHLLIYWL